MKKILIYLLSAVIVASVAIFIPKSIGNSQYKKGQEIEANGGKTKDAVGYYQFAAEHHNADACYRLGQLFTTQQSTYLKGIKFYEDAFKYGKKEAAGILAGAYLLGDGVEKDIDKGFYFAKKGARKKDAKSKLYLGYCYENGLGATRDEGKAFKYYKQSATSDNPDGLFYLAMCYMKGIGVEQNIEKGKAMIEESIQQGSLKAATYLNDCEEAYLNEIIECPICDGLGIRVLRNGDDALCVCCFGSGECTRKRAKELRWLIR